MAHYMRILGRVAGRAVRSHAFDRAISVATGYVISEMRLVDVRAKRKLLKMKRENHLHLLGRTVFRLHENGIEPLNDEHTVNIVRVLREIDEELKTVDEELERRKAFEAEKRRGSRPGAHNQNDRPQSTGEHHDGTE